MYYCFFFGVFLCFFFSSFFWSYSDFIIQPTIKVAYNSLGLCEHIPTLGIDWWSIWSCKHNEMLKGDMDINCRHQHSKNRQTRSMNIRAVYCIYCSHKHMAETTYSNSFSQEQNFKEVKNRCIFSFSKCRATKKIAWL